MSDMKQALFQAQEEVADGGEDPLTLTSKSHLLKASMKEKVSGLIKPPMPMRLSKSAYFTFENDSETSFENGTSTCKSTSSFSTLTNLNSSPATIPVHSIHSQSVDNFKSFQQRNDLNPYKLPKEAKPNIQQPPKPYTKPSPFQVTFSQFKEYMTHKMRKILHLKNHGNIEYINLEHKPKAEKVGGSLGKKGWGLRANPGLCVGVVTMVVVVGLVYGVWRAGRHLYHTHRHGVYVGCRLVHGLYEDRVHVFKGIQYAVPPVGRDYRWRPPQALDMDSCWEEPYIANKFGQRCCQAGYDDEGCEDCLYLNVWSPDVSSTARLNVMVYIHGGGLIAGSGNDPEMMPTTDLVKSSHMVYVTFNYRLGPLGFMALSQLRQLPRELGEDPPGASGNYGFMDQVLALKWVQQNIRSFGGDPSKVTVFGQDSGATSLLALLSAPSAAGLYSRVWMMSPSPRFEASREDVERQNKQGFLRSARQLSCSEAGLGDSALYDCLLSMSPADILTATNMSAWANTQQWHLPNIWEPQPVNITFVDGKFLENAPHDVWKKSGMNQVPILLGNTAQETDLQTYPQGLQYWNVTAFQRFVLTKLAPMHISPLNGSLQLYPIDSQHSPHQQLTSMVSDMRLTCGTSELLKVAAYMSTQPVYRYVLTDVDFGPQALPRFAYRGLDAKAFFGTLKGEGNEKEMGDLQMRLRDMVFEFVKEGKIEGWGTYPKQTALLSSSQVRMVEAYHKEACDYWRMQGMFPRYAWVN